MPLQSKRHRCIAALEQVCAFFPHCALPLTALALLDLHRRRFPFLACRSVVRHSSHPHSATLAPNVGHHNKDSMANIAFPWRLLYLQTAKEEV